MGSRSMQDPNEGIITQVPTFDPVGVSRNRYIPPDALERARNLAQLAGANPALVTSYLQNSQVSVSRGSGGNLEVRVGLSQPNEFAASNSTPIEREKSATLATRLLEIAYRNGVSSSDVSFNFQLGTNAERLVTERAQQNNLDPVEFRNRVILARISDNYRTTTIVPSSINHTHLYTITQEAGMMRGTVDYNPVNAVADVLNRGSVNANGRGLVFEVTADQATRASLSISNSRQIPAENVRLVGSIASFAGINRDELINAVQNLTVSQQYTGYGTSSVNVYPRPNPQDAHATRVYQVASVILRDAYHENADRVRGDFSEGAMFRSLTYLAYSPNLFNENLPVQMDPSTVRWINNQGRYYNLPDGAARIVFAYTRLFANTQQADRFLEYSIRRSNLDPQSAEMMRTFVPTVAEQVLREFSTRLDSGQVPQGQRILRLAATNMIAVEQRLAQVDQEIGNRQA